MDSATSRLPNDGVVISIDDINFTSVEALKLSGLDRNPHFDEIREDVIEFARSHGILLDNYEEYMDMTAYLYPYASKDRIYTISCVMMILFYIDDTGGEEGHDEIAGVKPEEFVRKILMKLQVYIGAMLQEERRGKAIGLTPSEIVDNVLLKLKAINLVPDDFLEGAIFKIWPELYRHSNMDFLLRFLRSVKEYLPQNVDLAFNANELRKYINYRVLNSGMFPTLDLIEYALDEYLLDDPVVKPIISIIEELRFSVAVIGSLTNDLCSYPKEVLDMKSNLNLVMVLFRKHFDYKLAIEESVEVINNQLEFFVSSVKWLIGYVKGKPIEEPLKRYCSSLIQVIRATREWQLVTKRYRHLDHIISELKDYLET